MKGIKTQLDVKLEIIKGRIAKCDVTVDGLANAELMERLTRRQIWLSRSFT